MQQFVFGDLRVQIFGEKIIRLEKAIDCVFCDQNTFFVPNRKNVLHDEHDVVVTQKGNCLVFGDYQLDVGANVTLKKCGKVEYEYQMLKNNGELPKPTQTPQVFAIADNPRIIEPKRGYTARQEDCTYNITENVSDVYLLLCNGDAKLLRKLYVELTGKCEMVRLATLGLWNSKYFVYDEQSAKQVILDYKKYNLPLDVMVIDTDWRSCENGWGYDINTDLFPDMQRFLQFAHQNDVEIVFNDHPEPNNGAHVFEQKEIAYREDNLRRLLELGVDCWWYDRNWMTHLNSPTPDVRWETFGMYLFYQITKHHYQEQAQNNVIYRRPVIMANVCDVQNGVYQGICDTASHRYSLQWTGDTMCYMDSLAQEVANLVKTGDNCIGYCSTDVGGHMGEPSSEEYLRWIQFGAMSPILRPHCSKGLQRNREPWVYDKQTLDIARDYVNMRYRLLPYVYSQAHKNYQNGEPIFPSMGFNYPTDARFDNCTNQYMLGKNVLISPICGETLQFLQPSNYASPVEVEFYHGRKPQGDPICKHLWQKLEMQLHHCSPVEQVPAYDFCAKISTTLCFDQPTTLILRVDDGATVKLDGKVVLQDDTLHSAQTFVLGVIDDNQNHSLEIDYFQAGGEACCQLLCQTAQKKATVIFPQGEWLDVFGGKIYTAKDVFVKDVPIKQMPLFVCLGAIFPLANNAVNTKNQSWQDIVFDYYPSKTQNDIGYLYEDDGQTTAYQAGVFRTTNYHTTFDENQSAYVVTIDGAVGSFIGERACKTRNVTLKVHLHEFVGNVTNITLNDKKVWANVHKIDKTAMPFEFAPQSCESDTLTVSFTTDVADKNVIKIFVD